MIHKTNRQQRGFTLVEMLVVAPIVVLAIGAFLTVIISLTGEVLASRASNVLSYNVQDALNRIEQDVNISTSFLATNNVFLDTTPTSALGTAQGYNDDKTAFTNVGGTSGTSIILNMVATTANPTSPSSSAVYLKDRPNACGSAQDINTPFSYNVIYFLKNDAATGTNTLWRRTVMPTSYNNTSTTVCNLPFQQPTCSPTYMSNNPGTTFCKTEDTRLVDGIATTDFVVKYFNSKDSVIPNLLASSTATTTANRAKELQTATTIDVSIKAKQTAAGRDVERAAELRISRLNTTDSGAGELAADGKPVAPIVKASLGTDTNVVFTWSAVAGATSYTIQYQRNGGAWTAGTTTSTATPLTVTGNTNGDILNARVIATNSVGTSGYGTATYTVPLWIPLSLENGWAYFGGGYARPSYTKTRAGLIVLKGLVKAGTGNIATLPAGYRPAKHSMFVNSSNNDGGRLDVLSDGRIGMSTGSNSWFSLDGVAFMQSGTAYTSPTLLNGWVTHSATWQSAGYMTDSAGRVQVIGLVKDGVTTTGTPIFTLPANSRSTEYQIIANVSDDVATQIGVNSSGQVLARGYGVRHISLQFMFYPTSRATGTNCSTQWCDMTMLNSWQRYGPVQAAPQYTKSSDGLVMIKGLVSSGTSGSATITNLPAGYCPSERLLFATTSYSNWARVDITPLANGTCNVNPSTGAVTSWFSLDNIQFIAD